MRNHRFLAKTASAAILALAAIGIVNTNNNTNSTVVPEIQTVQAAVQTKVSIPAGYTKTRVLKVNNGRLSRSQTKKLIQASMKGMEINQFYDTNASDQERTVDVTNLSWSEKEEISKYTLALINSARRQMGKRNWTYRKAAVKFADRVAQEYYNDDFSCWQRGHDVSGIKRAARACGLNYRAGQVYEDESGLPYGGNLGTTTRTMYELKKEIYFNVKQMLFGGFAGRESDYQDASRYTEWEHAGDLLGLRSMHGYDAKTKYFGVSFSNLADQPDHISVHMIGVAKRYILNYKRFNK